MGHHSGREQSSFEEQQMKAGVMPASKGEDKGSGETITPCANLLKYSSHTGNVGTPLRWSLFFFSAVVSNIMVGRRELP